MKTALLALLLAGLASGCGVLPPATPSVIQHDLGSGFQALARPPLALRTITVSASPLVAGLSMQYRTADQPTARGVYAFNRWAAAPASLVEQALGRLLPLEAAGRCRLHVAIADFILDADANSTGAAVVAANLRVSRDDKTPVFKRNVDIRIPLSRVQPAAGAEGMHQAVIALADQAASWVSGELDPFCND